MLVHMSGPLIYFFEDCMADDALKHLVFVLIPQIMSDLLVDFRLQPVVDVLLDCPVD